MGSNGRDHPIALALRRLDDHELAAVARAFRGAAMESHGLEQRRLAEFQLAVAVAAACEGHRRERLVRHAAAVVDEVARRLAGEGCGGASPAGRSTPSRIRAMILGRLTRRNGT